MIKVSVIVPVYNVEKYLSKCLTSLVNQTLEEIEIIVVNDGTKDNSQIIIDDFCKRFPLKVSSYIKENGGLSSARNYGIQFANGKYIGFVDSDDWVDTDMYKAMYDKAYTNDFDLVFCDFNEIRNDKAIECSCHLKNDLFNSQNIKEHMIEYYPSAWNKIYKKSLFSNIKFKEGIWFEDVEFGYRLLPFINSIGVVNQPYYQYLIRKGSITSSNDKRIYHYIDNWNGILDFYKKNNLYVKYKDELEYCYVRYIFATFIKSAKKFDKFEYKKAINVAIKNVNENFPKYKCNRYIKKNNLKNLYLRCFNCYLAYLLYHI